MMVDWQRVQEVFLAAADAPAEERPSRLDSLCAEDAELRAEVASLLAADCDSAATIAATVQLEASLLLAPEPLAGKRIGAYRILREIGRGGMGAVFLATRDDEAYQKQVAVKVVKPGMDTAEVLDRFRYERQILANLEHPFIARLFDGGSTDEGLPFFVMEYVEGEPVNAHCRAKTLDNRARCELFLKILEAVAYAHRNLVVHRDLKPGNIFVTGDGTPKLLDFGVAKLISGGGDGSATVSTILRPFTPEYASPEQVRGLAVTTATDIYSLGAVFYELLTDRRAQPIATPTPAEIERAVCELPVPRPSQIAPSVDEDLDNIVLMAMRKEPDRRYQSVDQFAEDIQRYLRGRPILARQDSISYRLRKFVVRNRLELGAVALLIATLSAGLAVSLRQTRRAEEALQLAETQRRRAEHENSRAEAAARRSEQARAAEAAQRALAQQQALIADQQRDLARKQTAIAEERLTEMFGLAETTLFHVHDTLAKLPGALAARKEIIQSTLKYLQELEKQSGMTDQMREALAAAYYKVARIQGDPASQSLQDFSAAEASLEKAKAVLLPWYEKKSGDASAILRWIEVQSEMADLANQAGRQQEAIAIYAALLPAAHRLAQIKPCEIVCETQEPVIENELAKKYLAANDPRGLEHARRGVALMKEVAARHPADRGVKLGVGSLLAAVASGLRDAGDLDEAAEDYRQSIQIREDLLKEQPNDATILHNLMVVYGNYAAALGVRGYPNLGRLADARAYAGKAVAIARDAVKADAQDATARLMEGTALARLGMIDPAPDDAQDGAKQSLAALEESYGLIEPIAKANKSATQTTQLAGILEFEGRRLEALARGAEAVASYRKSLDMLQPFLDAGNSAVIGQAIASEGDLARALASSGATAEALEVAARAVKQAEQRSAASPANERFAGALAEAVATLAAVAEKAGDLAQARQSATRALDLWKRIQSRGVLILDAEARAGAEELLARLGASRRGGAD